LPNLRRIALGLALALVTLATACGGDASSAADASTATVDAPATLLTVTRGGETLHALLALPQQEVTMDGSLQTGPWLRDVLAASDVGDWAHATVRGAGESRAFDVELAIESGPADTYILDITKRGTTKLAGLDLPRERWVRDVTEIRIDD
jgi:hypothetical protein